MDLSKIHWKGIAVAISAALTTLAALPYSMGDIATWVPPNWKPFVFKIGFVATILLRMWKYVTDQQLPKQ